VQTENNHLANLKLGNHKVNFLTPKEIDEMLGVSSVTANVPVAGTAPLPDEK
jgi:hypothetical protein